MPYGFAGNPQLPLTKFSGPKVKVPKLQRDPVKQKARQMLTAVLRHVREGHDLNPKSHRYYVQLARENPDLEEATELFTLLSDRRLKHQR